MLRRHRDVLHACGHDMHQTVLVGTAETLAALKLLIVTKPPGTQDGGTMFPP